MTEMALPLKTVRMVDTTSATAVARIRARYRAERRFRFYGIAAVCLAALFLMTLMTDIVRKALPAFTQHVVYLDVPLEASKLDPEKTKDPKVLAQGDYAALIRSALLARFPEVTDRQQRRSLTALLSSGADEHLRASVLQNPDLVGQSFITQAILSDDADMALKGQMTREQREKSKGIATLQVDGKRAIITSTADDFSPALARLRNSLELQLQKQRIEIKRFADLIVEANARLEAAKKSLQAAQSAAQGTKSQDNILEIAQRDVTSLSEKKVQLEQQLTAFEARLAARDIAETLSDNDPSLLVQMGQNVIKVDRLDKNRIEGQVLFAPSQARDFSAGEWELITLETPEQFRNIKDQEWVWLNHLKATGGAISQWNTAFLTSGDSREPELAGLLGGLIGSAWTMLVTLVLCLPVGVAAAIYLEEFAPKNRFTEIIEININNLAAVPSIVFGLLGLAMFLNVFGMPRSAPLVGGLVLALLILPTIIIASRAALKAVPPSIREAALGVGATPQQAVFHHVLPLAMPGIMTGTIIGMAHALGETAPLLMIGMVAFIVDVPQAITDAATVLPVQIFLWSDLPEPAFQAKTSAAILVLLLFLIGMNSLAILLRKNFERRW